MARSKPRGEPRAARGGFTLVELVVALALGALVVLGARAMLDGVGDAGDRLRAASAAADRAANGERLLRSALGQAERSRTTPFRGGAQEVRFATSCATPRGWAERCSASLTFGVADGAPALAGSFEDGAAVPLRTGFVAGGFTYLADARDGGRWLAQWEQEDALPIALGVVLDGDTTIVRVGAGS